MEEDSLLDIDQYMKRIQSGTGNLRLRESALQPFAMSQAVKPKSTSKRKDVSFFQKNTQKKFEEFNEEYQNFTQNNSMRKEYSKAMIAKDNRKNNYYSNITHKVQDQKKSQLNKQKQQQSKRVGTSRQDTKVFLENMARLVDTQHEALNIRLNEFKYKIKQHIEIQYNLFKQAMKNFVQEIFKASQSAFVILYQKKAVQLNAEFYVVFEQLDKLSHKIQGYIEDLAHPQWSRTIGQVDENTIKQNVQNTIDRSEKLQIKAPVIQLDKSHLISLQRTFRILLNPRRYNR